MSQLVEVIMASVIILAVLAGIAQFAEYHAEAHKPDRLERDLDAIASAWYAHARQHPTDDLAGISINSEAHFRKMRRFLPQYFTHMTSDGVVVQDATDMTANNIGFSPYGAPYSLLQNGPEMWILTPFEGVRTAQVLEGRLRGRNFEITAGVWVSSDDYEGELRDPLLPQNDVPDPPGCTTYNPIEPRLNPIKLVDNPDLCDSVRPVHDDTTQYTLAVKVDPPLKTAMLTLAKKRGDEYEREWRDVASCLTPPCPQEEVIVQRGMQSPITFSPGPQFNPHNVFGTIRLNESCEPPDPSLGRGAITVDEWGIPFACKRRDGETQFTWQTLVEPNCHSPTSAHKVHCSADRVLVGSDCPTPTPPGITVAPVKPTLIYPAAPPPLITNTSDVEGQFLDILQFLGPGMMSTLICNWNSGMSNTQFVPNDYQIVRQSDGVVVWAGSDDCGGTNREGWRIAFTQIYPASGTQIQNAIASFSHGLNVTNLYGLSDLYSIKRVERAYAHATPTDAGSVLTVQQRNNAISAGLYDPPVSGDPFVNPVVAGSFIGLTPATQEGQVTFAVPDIAMSSGYDPVFFVIKVGGEISNTLPVACPDPDVVAVQHATDPSFNHCPRPAVCAAAPQSYTAVAVPTGESWSDDYGRAGEAFGVPFTRNCVGATATTDPFGCVTGSSPIPECEVPDTPPPTRCECENSVEAYFSDSVAPHDDDYTKIIDTSPTATHALFTGQCWSKDVTRDGEEQACPAGVNRFLLTDSFPPPRQSNGLNEIDVACEQPPVCPAGYVASSGSAHNHTCELQYLDTSISNFTPTYPGTPSFTTYSGVFSIDVANNGASGATLATFFGGDYINSTNTDLPTQWICVNSSTWTATQPLFCGSPGTVYDWRLIRYTQPAPNSNYGCGGAVTGSSRGATCPLNTFEVDPYSELETPLDALVKGGQGQPDANSWVYEHTAGDELRGTTFGLSERHATILDCPPYMNRTADIRLPAALSTTGVGIPAFPSTALAPETCEYPLPLRKVDALQCPSGATAVGSPVSSCQIPHQAQQDIDGNLARITANGCPSGYTVDSYVAHPDNPAYDVARWCRKAKVSSTPSQVAYPAGASGGTGYTGGLSCYSYDPVTGIAWCQYSFLATDADTLTGSGDAQAYRYVVGDSFTVQPSTTSTHPIRRIEPAPVVARTFPPTLGCEIGAIDRDNLVCEHPTVEFDDEVCVDSDGDPLTPEESCDEISSDNDPPPLWSAYDVKLPPGVRFRIGEP